MNRNKEAYIKLLAVSDEPAVLYWYNPKHQQNSNFDILYINPVFEKILKEEKIAINVKNRTELFLQFEKAKTKEKRFSLRSKGIRDIDGTHFIEFFSQEVQTNNHINALFPSIDELSKRTCIFYLVCNEKGKITSVSESFFACYENIATNPEGLMLDEFFNFNYDAEARNKKEKPLSYLLNNVDARIKAEITTLGKKRFFELIHVKSYTDESGDKKSVIAAKEITSFENSIAELRAENLMLRQIIDTSPFRIYWKDTKMNYRGCNIKFAADLGLADTKSIEGKNDYDFINGLDPEFERNDDLRILETGFPKMNFEEYTRFANNKRKWLKRSKIPLLDEKGEIQGLIGTYQDITSQKEAEIQLAESEARFRDIADYLPQIVFEINPRGELTYLNKKAAQILNCSSLDEILGKHVLTFFEGEDKERAYNNLQKIAKGDYGKGNEYVMYDFDKNPIPVVIYTIPVFEGKQLKGYRGVIIDLRDIKRAESELLTSQLKFKNLFENMAQAACLAEIIKNEEGNIADLKLISVNPQWCKFFDKDKSHFENHNYITLFNSDNFINLQRLLLYSGKKNPQNSVTYVKSLDKYLEIRISIWDNSFCVILFNDLSELIKTQLEIEENKETFRIISGLTSDASSSLTILPDGHFQRKWFNMGQFEKLGYKEEEIDTFEKWMKLVFPEDIPVYKKGIELLMKGNKIAADLRIMTKDQKKIVWIRNTIFPIIDPESKRIVKLFSSIRDLSEFKDLIPQVKIVE